jgi:hypothetical protein
MCGGNRNLAPCTCADEEDGNRPFAALRSLLNYESVTAKTGSRVRSTAPGYLCAILTAIAIVRAANAPPGG